MRVDLISSRTYRATLPDDTKNNSSGYGSETYAAVLMEALSRRNEDWEFHWYAPVGSTNFDERENVTFHPFYLDFGKASEFELLDDCSIEGLSYTFLRDSDFIIDHSATAANIEELKWYHDFLKYVCYRNGYVAFNSPRLGIKERHYVVPSKQNQSIFYENGYDSIVCGYGIPEFYQSGEDGEFWKHFESLGLASKEYFLFLHRPTVDKGIDHVLRVAKELPEKQIVIAGNATIPEHYYSLLEARRQKLYQHIDNLTFIDIPLSPYHFHYTRELYRNAKAFLAPFHYPEYREGWGLASGEAVACGTPLIITDSPSTRELWIEGKDAVYIDSYQSLKKTIEYFDSISGLQPENKFSTDDYAKRYEEIAMLYNQPKQ